MSMANAERAMRSRGFRNRNPGNIDFVPANKWQGQVGIEQTGSPPRFAVFESHEMGIRALAVLLTTYFDRHGLNTVQGIINRWAPPKGRNPDGTPYTQNSEAYINYVAKEMGVGVEEEIDLHDYEDMRTMVRAIITHELGGFPYNETTLNEGLRRAGIVKPVTSVVEAAKTGTGQSAITIGALAVAAPPAAQIFTAMSGLNPMVGVTLVIAIAVVSVLLILLNRREKV